MHVLIFAMVVAAVGVGAFFYFRKNKKQLAAIEQKVAELEQKVVQAAQHLFHKDS